VPRRYDCIDTMGFALGMGYALRFGPKAERQGAAQGQTHPFGEA